jgi:non-heme chloroperoxidase
MSYITTQDGTQIYYKDWGAGTPIVFSHGWPLSADAFDEQMVFLAARGYRCIAHDRRGHGRSSQPSDGNNMDTYADDLATLVQKLQLKKPVHVAHSTGGGEVTRFLARHGTKNVAKVVLISAIPPKLLKTESSPDGIPREGFDQILGGILNDRSQFFMDLSAPFYGFNRPGAKISQGIQNSFWLQAVSAGLKNVYECVNAIADSDFHEDLKKIDVPTLFLHGDDDQVVPVAASSIPASKIVKGSTLKVYPGFPHGMYTTHKNVINEDLLGFLKA